MRPEALLPLVLSLTLADGASLPLRLTYDANAGTFAP